MLAAIPVVPITGTIARLFGEIGGEYRSAHHGREPRLDEDLTTDHHERPPPPLDRGASRG